MIPVLVLPWLLYSWPTFDSHAHHLQSLLQQCSPVMEDCKFTVIKWMGWCNLSLCDLNSVGFQMSNIMQAFIWIKCYGSAIMHVCHNWNLVESYYCNLEYQEEMHFWIHALWDDLFHSKFQVQILRIRVDHSCLIIFVNFYAVSMRS